ncbi:unnamed protein product [Cyclocybe aegerita]|uniref:Enoyl reductase (ER) domain-containing protein n=1 Tax=Cyclocybe aegerita TaxID=1973307 RepID=A0A8S0VS91_CYCAE|nr:unnamed protein product [Cyclocybe aegerita]
MHQTQKALLLDRKFGNFVVGDTEKYKPGPGEILIKVHSVALNPADWKIQKSGLFIEEFPAILGIDIAGEVVELGTGVTEHKLSDRVSCQSQWEKDKAGFQQHAVSLAVTAAKIPPNISYDEAATLPIAVSTAYLGLYNQKPHGAGFSPPLSSADEGKYAGVPIIVLGGASSVASLKHTDFLKSLGATYVFDRNLSFDTLRTEATQTIGLDLVAPDGTLVIVLNPEVKSKDGKLVVPFLAGLRMPQNLELLETLYHEKITGFLERGLIKIL